MAIAKYEVIAEGPMGQAVYWDGLNLRRKGEIVEVDTDVVKVASDSKSLIPVGNSPVFDTKVTKDNQGNIVTIEKVPGKPTQVSKPGPNSKPVDDEDDKKPRK